MRAYAQSVLFIAIGNPLVYLFSLGVGLAALIQAPIPLGDGTSVSYLTFVAPALVGAAALTIAVEESTYPYLMGFKWNPIFYGMNAAPISGRQIVDGMTIGIAVRTVVTCGIYFVFTVLFGAVPNAWGFVLIFTTTFTGLAIGLVISSYTATIEEDRGQMALIGRFVVMPLFLFSGTFFPITALPIWLQWIGWISPLWHGTQLARGLAFGLPEPAWLVVVHVVVLVGLFVFGLLRTRAVVTRRLNK